jgi:carbonic anhydrase
MPYNKKLFDRNRAWAKACTERDPDFFKRLVDQQAPEFLWIGCADSRVPADQIMGLQPGEVFVHRNIANIVMDDDLNGQSVIQYAVDVIGVQNIIICGHYGCGGVLAALRNDRIGLADEWLAGLAELARERRPELEVLSGEAERHARLCELNVIEQVSKLSRSPILDAAWARGQEVAVHGWIYALNDGLLRDLGLTVTGPAGERA